MKRGFTLIELLVVISIIGTLTSISYVGFKGAQDKGRDAKRKQDLAAISTALVSFYQDNNQYPPTCTSGCAIAQYTSDGAAPWIPGLTSSYLQNLPKDPKQLSSTGEVASSHTTGMVAYWPLNEGSGTTASDATGNGNTATLSGPFWTTGQISGALSFDGSNDTLNLGADKSFATN